MTSPMIGKITHMTGYIRCFRLPLAVSSWP